MGSVWPKVNLRVKYLFDTQSRWWCPALWRSSNHLPSHIEIHVFPHLAGSVRLFCCLLVICPPQKAIRLSISLAGGVWFFSCLQFICFSTKSFICLPVWLVVSGFSAVSKSCAPPRSHSCVSQSGWCPPALGLSSIDVPPRIAIHLSSCLAGGVLLSCRLQFIGLFA